MSFLKAFLNNLPIRMKILAMLVAPILGLLYFSVSSVSERSQIVHEMDAIQPLSQLAVKASALVHETQKERGATAGFLGSNGQKFVTELPAQRINTDKRHSELKTFLEDFDSEPYGSQFGSQLNTALSTLTQLESKRSVVSSMNITTKEALRYYTGLNASLLGLIGEMTELSNNGAISRSIAAYFNFLQGKERAGIERAVLSNTFARDNFGPGIFRRFGTLVAEQETYAQVFLSLATDDAIQFFEKKMGDPLVAEVKRMREIGFEKFNEGSFGIDPIYWFKTITGKINLLKDVEDRLSEDLTAQVDSLRSDAMTALVGYSTLMGVAIAIALVLAFFVGRRLVSGMLGIVTALREVEERGDFSNRASATGSDEIGTMAAALNNHMEALQQAIGSVDGVMTAAADGDFGQRVEVELKGDLDNLKNSVNTSINAVQTALSEVNNVMDAVARGDFAQRVQGNFEGEFATFRDNVNGAVDGLEFMTKALSGVMDAMVAGDFSFRMSEQVEGGIRQTVDSAMESMEAVVREVSEVMQAVAEGDLQKTVSGSYRGAFKQLQEHVNATIYRLADIVSQLSLAAGEVRTGATEIAQGNTDLSRRTESQASALEETASSMEEMTGTVKQSSENTEMASQLAEEAKRKAQSGGKVVSKATGAMREINRSSKKISDIIAVIDEIAFQTNLLALNAAVEAARAGEQGRGFAVVAGEVRGLAQRSASAAQEIKMLILESVEKAEHGSSLVDQSGKTLAEIVASIEEMASMSAEMASTAKEQSIGINEVNSAITDMDEMTQQNAGLVEEAAAAAQSMAEQAGTMAELAGFFTVGKRSEAGPSLDSKVETPGAGESDPSPEQGEAEGNVVALNTLPQEAPPVDDEWAEF